jgi:two-component system, NarL family, nitrate/nitrite response regulator NarL
MKVGTQTVSVVVVEDHPIYRRALEEVIRRDDRMTFVASIGDGELAIDLIREHEPDVALLDIGLPGLDGLSILAELAGVTTRCVVLSGDPAGATVHQALQLGAVGYLSKDLDADAICAAIITAACGETVVSRQLQTGMVEYIRAGGRHASLPPLTDREQRVLVLTARGLSTTEVAGRMHISETTVKTHLSSSCAKLGANNRTSAVARAITEGMVRLD